MQDSPEISPVFKQPFLEWLDDPAHGFNVANTWDATKDVMGGRGKLKLFDFQRRILGHVLNYDPITGKFPYTTVILSMPKKSGKTAINAAITAWFYENAPLDTEAFVIANDLEQAEGRVLSDIKFHCKLRGDSQVLKYEIRNDATNSRIQALSKSYRSNAGSRHSLTSWDELWGVACTTPDTECYTKEGWKSYSDINVGELIATYNIHSEAFEWKPILKIYTYDYDGDMYYLKHRRSDMMISPTHKVIGKFKTSGRDKFDELNWETRTAIEAQNSYEGLVPTQAKWIGNGKTTFELPSCDTIIKGSHHTKNHWDSKNLDALRFFEFMGYYLSEGCIIYTQKGGSPCAVSIAQSNKAHPNIVNQIKECLEGLGFTWSYDGHHFRVSSAQLATYLDKFGKCYEKYIPDEMKEYDSAYLQSFINAFMDGDGWEAGNGFQFEITSKKLTDDILECGLKCGYTPRYMGIRRRGLDGKECPNHYHTVYRASLSKGNVCYHRKNWKKLSYSGIIWCPSTENGTWLAKRNGCIYWTGNSEESRRLWDEMQPIPMFEYSLRLITTYAGFYGESDLLWELYLAGVGADEHPNGKGHKIAGLEDLPCYANGRLFVYWDHECRMPWQTEEFLEEARRSERPASYLRLFENRWVTSHEAFMPVEWWDYAAEKYAQSAELWHEHPYRKAPCYIAVDAGIKRDCTAVMGVTFDPKIGKIVLLFHKIWKPIKGEPLDLDTTLDPFIRKAWKDYNVKEIACDPSQLLQMKKRWEKDGMKVYEVTQAGKEMTNASQLLFDLFHDQNFWAYPDEEIREHLRNSMAEQTSSGLRIVKDKSNRRMEEKKVDAAVALAMASYRAVENTRETPSEPIVFESPFSDLRTPREDPLQKNLPRQLRDDIY